MFFTEDDNVVEALAANGTDQPFHERILPGRVRGRQDFLDAQALQLVPELASVTGIVVANEEAQSGIPGEGLDNLLVGPFRGGMAGDVEMDNAAAVMTENDQDVEQAESCCWHDEEIQRSELRDMIVEEGTPGLRRRLTRTDHVPGDGRSPSEFAGGPLIGLPNAPDPLLLQQVVAPENLARTRYFGIGQMLPHTASGLPEYTAAMLKIPREVEEQLGIYVYAYIDPRYNRPFYIGKGHAGRVMLHLTAEGESRRLALIEDIRAAGLEPQLAAKDIATNSRRFINHLMSGRSDKFFQIQVRIPAFLRTHHFVPGDFPASVHCGAAEHGR